MEEFLDGQLLGLDTGNGTGPFERIGCFSLGNSHFRHPTFRLGNRSKDTFILRRIGTYYGTLSLTAAHITPYHQLEYHYLYTSPSLNSHLYTNAIVCAKCNYVQMN